LRTRQQHDGRTAQQIWKVGSGNAVLTKSGTIGKNDTWGKTIGHKANLCYLSI